MSAPLPDTPVGEALKPWLVPTLTALGLMLASGFVGGYVAYWQGFYRGADTALCAMALFAGRKETKVPSCVSAVQPFYVWRQP